MQGLKSLQAAGRNFVHLDLKAENIFVDRHGTTKVADFGTATKGGKMDLPTAVIPAPPQQKPPELLRAESNMSTVSRELSNANDIIRVRNEAILSAHFPNLSGPDHEALRSNLLNSAEAARSQSVKRGEIGRAPVTTDGIDSWAMGSAAFKMIYGRPIAHHAQFVGKVHERIEQFGAGSASPIDITRDDSDRTGNQWDTAASGSFAGRSGNPNVDDLLIRLLHPKAERRIKVADALKYPALTTGDVGSDTTRGKLAALLNDDVAALRRLRGPGG